MNIWWLYDHVLNPNPFAHREKASCFKDLNTPHHEILDISQAIVSLTISGNLVFVLDSHRSEKKMAMRIRFPFAGNAIPQQDLVLG